MKFSKYEILEERCKNCGACLEICPDKAIMHTEKDVCRIDQALCSYCGMCIEACQVNAVKKTFSISVLFGNWGGSKERSIKIYA